MGLGRAFKKEPKTGLGCLLMLGLAGAFVVHLANEGTPMRELARPADWEAPTSHAGKVVKAFLEMERGSYRATLTRPVTVWQTVQDIEQAQKYTASHPAGTPLLPSLKRTIACRLPAGAHVVANPWPQSRYEELMTPDGPAGYCDGVVRLPPP